MIAVLTAKEAGPLKKGKRNTAPLLAGPEVAHYHQAVALVIAESFEQARAAGALVKVSYETAEGAFDLAAAKDGAAKPEGDDPSLDDTQVGDFAGAFAQAPVTLDATYTTPDESHAMMEPHATLAAWEGERLTLWTSNQMVAWGVTDMATTSASPRTGSASSRPSSAAGSAASSSCAPTCCWRRSARGWRSGRSRSRCRGR